MLRVESTAQEVEGTPLVARGEETNILKYGKALGKY